MRARYIFRLFAAQSESAEGNVVMRASKAVAAALSTLIAASPAIAQEPPHKAIESTASPWRNVVWGSDSMHIRAAAAPHPVRFASGLKPAFRISTGEFSKTGGKAVKIPEPSAPKEPDRPYGVFSGIADQVDALVEEYDKMELRPAPMEDGGGIEYHVIFGAPPRD